MVQGFLFVFNQENVSHPVLCPLLFEGGKGEIVTIELALLAEEVVEKVHVWIVLQCKEDISIISCCHHWHLDRIKSYLAPVMATHQDCWKGKEREAIEWLKNLKIGDKLLHPPVGRQFHSCKPDGQDFEEVTIQWIHPKDPQGAHVVVRFPDRDPMWDKRLPLKYAFAGLFVQWLQSPRFLWL